MSFKKNDIIVRDDSAYPEGGSSWMATKPLAVFSRNRMRENAVQLAGADARDVITRFGQMTDAGSRLSVEPKRNSMPGVDYSPAGSC